MFNIAGTQRPILITLICILGFIGVAISLPFIFSPFVFSVGAWYPPYFVLSLFICLLSMIGLWRMKKWGVILYTVMTGISQVVLLVTGMWSIGEIIIPGLVVAVGFHYLSRMD